MLINGVAARAIWTEGDAVAILDQTLLPHKIETVRLATLEDAAKAIKIMQVRGAPLIGVTAAFGMALAMRADASDAAAQKAASFLRAQRPTAVNLAWAVEKALEFLQDIAPSERAEKIFGFAQKLADDDVAANEAIGEHGLKIFREAASKRGDKPLRVLTHCNAGWLATVDWGTATAPIYKAQAAEIPLEIFVDETRPRNQGASLTAFELGQQGVEHHLIVDNAGGHFMRRGEVDLVIVGADRIAANGDVCNKIGTYLKALAAHDNAIPFYVAAPSSTFDFALEHGDLIPIEERDEAEVLTMAGRTACGGVATVGIAPETTHARNPGFDVTPARLVTGIITEKGVFAATTEALQKLACGAA